MKKLIFLFAGALLIIASCSKDSGFFPGSDQFSTTCKEYSLHGNVIVVPPDKDGNGDDSAELADAFSASRKGTVIQLLEGEYHVGYLEIYNFQGTVKGAGKEKTKIILKPFIDQIAQLNSNQTACWWRLIGGDIRISDITFITPDGFLSEVGDYVPEYGSDLLAIFMVNNYNDEYYHPDGPPQKFIVSDCNFIGGTNTDLSHEGFWITDHNTYIAVWVGVEYAWPKDGVDYPLTKGDYLFKDCYFEHFLDGVEGFSLGEEATLTVTDCNLNKCMWPLFFIANYNSRINLTNNWITNSTDGDIVIEDIDFGFLPNTEIKPLKRCIYNITGNHFSDAPIASIQLFDSWIATDPSQRLPMLFTIKNNVFNLNGTGSAINAFNSQDIKILNNLFTGTCNNGIVIDGAMKDIYGIEVPLEVYAKNAQVIGNNFSRLNSSNADIVLGEKSSNCTVIGSGRESVINNGTNNKIISAKMKPGEFHFNPLNKINFRNWKGHGHQ